ncbi:uncharacterized protein BJ212DRAFT_1477209 [Suillus subaureus]|uniref:Uncharacterized protein n=1 Tax=Suillus subaureus TaxID=48587 RepID=A0A9P7EIF6_9AGAM|nr:uncharacterized protein BJ212DRAFT_1477209 [Suillus subaureus]KAG1822802.1 hypothetical protein BJ212DRAFT_1477209 [Suillus subaureus]
MIQDIVEEVLVSFGNFRPVCRLTSSPAVVPASRQPASTSATIANTQDVGLFLPSSIPSPPTTTEPCPPLDQPTDVGALYDALQTHHELAQMLAVASQPYRFIRRTHLFKDDICLLQPRTVPLSIAPDLLSPVIIIHNISRSVVRYIIRSSAL